MELARRTRWLALALPVALAATTALARPGPPGVLGAAPTPLLDCSPDAAAAPHGGGNGAPAWYRLDPLLDANGTLVGRRLTAGRASARWTEDLPPESFASGPAAGRVLVGDDDGTRSRLRELDTVAGCWAVLATERSVIRSALLTSDGTSLYEHRVDRASRRDQGVWQRDTAASGAAWLALPGLEAAPGDGPIFATSLLVAGDGSLVVASCGERACRTRVMDPHGGTVSTADGTGPAVGAYGGRLISLGACEALPCGLASTDLATQTTSILDTAAAAAGVALDEPVLVVVADLQGLGVVRLGAPGAVRAVPGTPGLAPIASTSTADSGIETPPGLVAVAADGRIGTASSVRFLDPATLQLSAGEVHP